MGGELRIAVRHAPGKEVWVLRPSTRAVLPARHFGTVLVDGPEIFAHGRAASDGVFRCVVQVPDNDRLAGIELYTQAVCLDDRGRPTPTECKTTRIESR